MLRSFKLFDRSIEAPGPEIFSCTFRTVNRPTGAVYFAVGMENVLLPEIVQVPPGLSFWLVVLATTTLLPVWCITEPPTKLRMRALIFALSVRLVKPNALTRPR